MKENRSLLGNLREEAALLYGVCVDFLGHVLLQLELIARSNQFILQRLEDIFDDFNESTLTKVDEAVEDHEGLVVRNHV